MTRTLPPVHLAGICVADVVIRNVRLDERPGVDGWSPSNFQILDREPEAVPAGGAGWPAYLLAGMGHAVQLNAPVGHDLFGEFLRARLGRAGVEFVGPPAQTSAVSVITSTPGGLRKCLGYPGEPINWQASAAAMASRPRPGWFFATGHSGVQASDVASLKRLFAELRERDVHIVFDPSPWFAGRVGRSEMLELLSMVHCLSATESELGEWFPSPDAGTLAQRVLDGGVECVVVKQGAEGASFAGAGAAPQRVCTTPVAGANTVGAGDTLNAGLLHGLSTGVPFKDAVAFAVQIATEVVRVGRNAFRPAPRR